MELRCIGLVLLIASSWMSRSGISLQNVTKHTLMCISAVAASLQPHNGVSSPLHSAPYLLQKQRFINCSHLLAGCACTPTRARVTQLSLSAVASLSPPLRTRPGREVFRRPRRPDDRGSRGEEGGFSIQDKKLPAALCSVHLCQI